MGETKAASVAAARVRAVGDSTRRRYDFAADFYTGDIAGYRRAELSFLGWAIARGVLSATGGSRWWRGVNDRILLDKAEARLLHDGWEGEPSAPSVELWGEFLRTPAPGSWYCAHNASVVAGYLEHRELAEEELPAERFMMNVALLRVLFTHVLVSRPRLALGAFASAGPLLADPRRGSVGFFLDLRNAFPARYPLTGVRVEELLGQEGRLPRLLDYGIIAPKLGLVYKYAAESLGQPRIAELISDGAPCYAWPTSRRALWNGGGGTFARLVTRATRAM